MSEVFATIGRYEASNACVWCEKSAETVNITMPSGFLREAPLCFRCLTQAIRAHARQQNQAPKSSPITDRNVG